MNNGHLKVVEAAIDENVSMQQRAASDFNDMKDEVRKNFDSLYKIDKVTGGLNGLQNTTAEIADGIERISFINRKHLNNFVEIDKSLASKIDQLEMSHDFVGNNSLETNSYNMTILEKIDGKSVNEGAKTTEQVEKVGESSIVGMQSLTDLTKGATVEQHAEEIKGVTGISLGDISNGNANEEQHAEEIKGINGISLGDISNGNAIVEQHVQDIQGINGISLENLNNGNDIVKLDVNDDYSVEGQVNLEKLNSNNSTQKVELDDSRL